MGEPVVGRADRSGITASGPRVEGVGDGVAGVDPCRLDLGVLVHGVDTALDNAASVPFVGHGVGDLAGVQFIEVFGPRLKSALVDLGSRNDIPSDDAWNP